MKLAALSAGFIPLGRWWRVPVRLHWSVPLAAVLLGRLRLVPGLWVGVLLLPLIHELGHAWFIRRFRQRLVQIDLLPTGGIGVWRGEVTQLRRAIIALGGVMAQSVVLAGALAARFVWGPFASPFATELCNALIWVNLGMFAINLIPVHPLDGEEAWRLVPLLVHRYRVRMALRTLTDHKQREFQTLAADLEEDRLSPDLKRQLDRLTEEVQAEAERKAELNRS